MTQQQRRVCRSSEVVHLIQSFIHTMNNKSLRRNIIQKTIRLCGKEKTHRWLGSWIVELDEAPEGAMEPPLQTRLRMIQQVQQMRQAAASTAATGYDRLTHRELMKRMNLSLTEFVNLNTEAFQRYTCLFTVMIVYNGNLVHYVAFIYNPITKTLISFDSGLGLYDHGRKTILPATRRAFRNAGLIGSQGITMEQDMGGCYGYKFCGKEWGVQYNGLHQSSLPADSFCQTWTIFFLKRYLEKRDGTDFSFVRSWCRVHPGHREFIVIRDFILPLLSESEKAREAYFREIGGDKSYCEVVDILKTYVEKCSMGINKPDVTCPSRQEKLIY